MTDLPLGDDNFLVMEAFSDADIDDPEIASVEYPDPEPMSESAWARAVASAVSGEQSAADEAEPLLEPGDAPLGFEPLVAHDDGDLDDVLDEWYPADGADGPDQGAHADRADAAGDDAPAGET
jgi:hypothetical protein